jgi:hypothetical protein
VDLNPTGYPPEDWIAALRDDLVLSNDTTALGPFTASGVIMTNGGRLKGYTIRATTATIAVVRLWDGAGTGGQAVATLDVSQGFAIVFGPMDKGVHLDRGLYLEVVSGAPEIVVYVADSHGIALG